MMWIGQYKMNLSDEVKNDEMMNVDAQKYHMHELNGKTTERHDVEYRENQQSDNEAIRTERTKGEVGWLASLMVFCSSVSVVGLSYVANPSASAFRRSVWILLLLAGAAFTTYQMEDRIVHYLSHPVNVLIHEEYSEEMVFPTVTVCNENRASLSKMASVGKYRRWYK